MEQSVILVVEDDSDIREGISLILNSENYIVKQAANGYEGLEKLDEDIDLVILDVMMPGISGITTCQKIREISNVPVLFLTAKSTDKDKLLGFESGGDDYLIKPFSYTELIARVNALIRRYHIYKGKDKDSVASEKITIGDVCIDSLVNNLTVDGKEVELTDLEYRLLLMLMKNAYTTFSAQQLYEEIWNEPFLYSSNSTIMVHIYKLRTKIEQTPETPKHIKTVWGKGYRFE